MTLLDGLPHYGLLFLIVMAFMAGLVDAMVGGGGLIQIPALFSTLTTATPSSLLGTNKFSSFFGTASAALRYSRKVQIPWRTAAPAALAAFAGSWSGAGLTDLLPVSWMRPLVLLLLVAIAFYTFRRHELGEYHAPKWKGKLQVILALCAGASIGFYDGFFGPGTGTFLLFIWVRGFGFDFLHATATAKVVNATTNAAALVYFVPHGHILWAYALPMAVSNIVGAQIGSRLALKHGASFIRKLFLVLVCLLITKMAWQIGLRIS
ncbi:MAG: sulfite exporter TauE/SafE family protein [Methylophilaceae bacterium]